MKSSGGGRMNVPYLEHSTTAHLNKPPQDPDYFEQYLRKVEDSKRQEVRPLNISPQLRFAAGGSITLIRSHDTT